MLARDDAKALISSSHDARRDDDEVKSCGRKSWSTSQYLIMPKISRREKKISIFNNDIYVELWFFLRKLSSTPRIFAYMVRLRASRVCSVFDSRFSSKKKRSRRSFASQIDTFFTIVLDAFQSNNIFSSWSFKYFTSRAGKALAERKISYELWNERELCSICCLFTHRRRVVIRT